MNIPVERIEVQVEGDLDLRGTLGIEYESRRSGLRDRLAVMAGADVHARPDVLEGLQRYLLRRRSRMGRCR